jgi:alpha-tubulin suppressor-like RCC1 family protein
VRAGELYCWGWNFMGQLGLGNSGAQTERTTPTRIGQASDWVAVAAGYEHTCGVRGGALYCWGDITYGQGGASASTTPLRVGALADWTSVSATVYATTAVRAGGVYAWGKNSYGALGLGTTALTGTPTALTPATWSHFGLGDGTSCGVREGALYCWGSNFQGKVGDGSNTDRLAQTRVGEASDWTIAVTAQTQSCGVKAGRLYCWGTTGRSPNYGFGAQWAPAPILSPQSP